MCTSDTLVKNKVKLLEERGILIEEIKQARGIIWENGSESGDDGGDIAWRNQEKDRIIRGIERKIGKVAKIDQTLQKMEGGVYGICMACGKPIDDERLEAEKGAAICRRCCIPPKK